VYADGRDDGAVGRIPEVMAESREFGRDLESDRQNGESGAALQFTQQVAGIRLEPRPSSGQKGSNFKQRNCGNRERPSSGNFRSDDAKLVFRQPLRRGEPADDNVGIEQELGCQSNLCGSLTISQISGSPWTISPTISTLAAQEPSRDFQRRFGARVTFATGRPRLVTVTVLPFFSTSSRTDRHLALNSVAVMTRFSIGSR